MDVDAYLDRIGFRGAARVDLDTLTALTRAHLYTVPFENLDIDAGVPIVLDEDHLYDKIVRRRRGGFCYELNGLFARLLEELGFRLERRSCRVFDDERIGPDFDHLALVVSLGGRRWLTDVGFGEGPRQPLELADGTRITEVAIERVIERRGDQIALVQHMLDGSVHGYLIGHADHPLEDFANMCHYHQTSPESPFTGGPRCSVATVDGRLTVRGNWLITTRNGQRTKYELAPYELDAARARIFEARPPE